jgi:hypothetical protein
MIYNPTETPVRIKKKKRIKIGKEFHILKQLNNIVGHIELCSEKKKKSYENLMVAIFEVTFAWITWLLLQND